MKIFGLGIAELSILLLIIIPCIVCGFIAKKTWSR